MNCPDPYPWLNIGSREFTTGLTKALAAFIGERHDPQPLIDFAKANMAALDALVNSPECQAFHDSIVKPFHAATDKAWDRSFAAADNGTKLALDRAKAMADFVAEAMKNGLSEDGAMRILDRASLHLWTVDSTFSNETVNENIKPPTENESPINDALKQTGDLLLRYAVSKASTPQANIVDD